MIGKKSKNANYGRQDDRCFLFIKVIARKLFKRFQSREVEQHCEPQSSNKL
uniref:Bm42 n=1 Tax=Brugia malayi TaxID=6279 RepID=A0A0J9XLZ6_BRUMA|nr:Bm42 [Brugia malayi]